MFDFRSWRTFLHFYPSLYLLQIHLITASSILTKYWEPLFFFFFFLVLACNIHLKSTVAYQTAVIVSFFFFLMLTLFFTYNYLYFCYSLFLSTSGLQFACTLKLGRCVHLRSLKHFLHFVLKSWNLPFFFLMAAGRPHGAGRALTWSGRHARSIETFQLFSHL